MTSTEIFHYCANPISKFASHVAQFLWNILHLRDRCLGCARCAPPAVNSAADRDRDRPRTAPACPHPPALVNGRKLSIVRLAGAAAVAPRSIATMPSAAAAAAARVSLTYLRCRCHHAHGKCSDFSILMLKICSLRQIPRLTFAPKSPTISLFQRWSLRRVEIVVVDFDAHVDEVGHQHLDSQR